MGTERAALPASVRRRLSRIRRRVADPEGLYARRVHVGRRRLCGYMAVHPSARGSGLGTLLFRRIIEQFKTDSDIEQKSLPWALWNRTGPERRRRPTILRIGKRGCEPSPRPARYGFAASIFWPRIIWKRARPTWSCNYSSRPSIARRLTSATPNCAASSRSCTRTSIRASRRRAYHENVGFGGAAKFGVAARIAAAREGGPMLGRFPIWCSVSVGVSFPAPSHPTP